MSSPDEPKKDEPKKEHNIIASVGSAATFFAASIGIPFERIIKATGINPTALINPDTRISERFMLEVFRLLDKAPSKKNLSLELVRAVPFTFLGSSWKLLRMSPDLQTMQTLLAENSDLIADQFEIEITNTTTESIVQTYHPFDEIDGGMGGEVCIGIGARIMWEYFGNDVLARVQFQHEARRPVSVYEEFFKVPVTFNADCNAIVSHRKFLNQTNKKAQEETKKLLEWRLAHLRQELGMSDADVLADIHKAIAYNAKKGEFSVFRLAQRMKISPRSLQRRTNKAGTNAQTLLDKARYAKALELLANENIPNKEVATRLGFSDESSFHKAFQRWSQKTPAQVRREIMQKE